MTTLFDATKPVKPARDFGRGMAPTPWERRMPYTQADLDWWAQESNANATDYYVIEPARDWDQEAGEAEALFRHETGIPFI